MDSERESADSGSMEHKIPDNIPDRLIFCGKLVRISGGLACYAMLHFSGGGPGYSAEPELDEVSEAWVADRSEWDATFAEEPTPEAIQRHLDEALEEVEETVKDAIEDDKLANRIGAFESRRWL